MSLCVVDGGQCSCNPQVGQPCPGVEKLKRSLADSSKRIEELETVCSESYQVVGSLASDAGVFGTVEVDRALTNLSDAALTHTDVLPFPSRPTRASELEQELEQERRDCQAAARKTLEWHDDAKRISAYAGRIRAVAQGVRAELATEAQPDLFEVISAVRGLLDAIEETRPEINQSRPSSTLAVDGTGVASGVHSSGVNEGSTPSGRATLHSPSMVRVPIDFDRRVKVEQRLLDAASGKRPLPTREECRELAHILGIPDEHRKPLSQGTAP
jgi:hypothetical protein